ncbi:MAG TPA: glutathione S-transferase N-terminal domain-containing protein [Acetobacteraceae bacterium]|jgi:glutathione S-transferase|nr:glutathione S-transferase N-terminal domain-containing protein [Acetobacteraceae bacterium]
MKLIYSPGACSIGIHVLLEEIGRPYEAEATKLQLPVPERPLTKVNPKSKVPTLVRDDGSVLTEFAAIAYYLAKTNPEKQLLPADTESEVRALETMDYCVSTVHMRGFSRLFGPGNYAPNESDYDTVKARGREMVQRGFELLDKALDGQDYVVGRFSVADAALFYVEFWGADRMNMTLPPALAGHLARMKARPAVAATLKAEGFA